MTTLQDALAEIAKEREDMADERRDMQVKYNTLTSQHEKLGEKVDKLEESISELVKMWKSANLGLDIIKWISGVVITSFAVWTIIKPYIGMK